MWDGIGRLKEASGTPTVYIRGANPLRSIAAAKETFHLAPDLLGRGFQCLAAWIDHDRPLWIQPFQFEAHGFADTPAYAVARHSLANRARHRKANARTALFGLPQAKCREQGTGKAATFIIDFTEIFRPQDTDTFRKTWDGRLPFVANRELLAPGSPPARQHGTAILGFHAAAKAVRFGAMAVVRLKSTFRHVSSSI